MQNEQEEEDDRYAERWPENLLPYGHGAAESDREVAPAPSAAQVQQHQADFFRFKAAYDKDGVFQEERLELAKQAQAAKAAGDDAAAEAILHTLRQQGGDLAPLVVPPEEEFERPFWAQAMQ